MNSTKLKIHYQTQENINDILITEKTLNKKKWKKYLNIKKKTNKKFVIPLKPIRVKTLYKERLKSYKKFNYFYGNLKRKQLKTYYSLLMKKKNIMDCLIMKLEKRLDIFLYRTSLFDSLFQIQQLISHQKIQVNWNKLQSKNYELKPGDYVMICPTIQKYKIGVLPSYMEWNASLNLLCLFKEPVITDFYYTFTFDKTLVLDFIK